MLHRSVLHSGSWKRERSERHPTFDQQPAFLNRPDQHIRQWFQSAVKRWCEGQTRPTDVALINFLLKFELLPNTIAQAPQLRAMVDRYRELENQIEFPRTVNSMDERLVAKTGVFFNVRGNVDAMGELVFPTVCRCLPDATRLLSSQVVADCSWQNLSLIAIIR